MKKIFKIAQRMKNKKKNRFLHGVRTVLNLLTLWKSDFLARTVSPEVKTILDLGCGSGDTLKYFSDTFIVGVDLCEASLKRSQGNMISLRGDIMGVCSKLMDKTFDLVTAFDLIEHFEKKDGLRLLDEMERIARKQVILFTPNGFLPQEPDSDEHMHDNEALMKHRSGWIPEDFIKRGYLVKVLKNYHKNFDALWAVKNLPVK